MASLALTLRLVIPPLAVLDPAQRRAIFVQEYGVALTEITETLADQARRLVAVDRGILRSSIFAEVKPGSGPVLVTGMIATGPQAPHAPYVEHGTAPHWAPIGPLKAWARRVLGDERLGYAVQRAIARRGTRPRPFFGPVMEKARQVATPSMQAAQARTIARVHG